MLIPLASSWRRSSGTRRCTPSARLPSLRGVSVRWKSTRLGTSLYNRLTNGVFTIRWLSLRSGNGRRCFAFFHPR
jgi:hypothetical protein